MSDPVRAVGQPAPATVRLELSGSRPADAVRDLSGIYGGDRWAASAADGAFDYRYTALGDGDVTIRRVRLRGTLSGSVPVGRDYVVVWAATGTSEVERNGEQYAVPLDTPVLLPPDHDFSFRTRDHDQRIVHLDRSFVQRVAATRIAAGADPLRFDDRRVPEPEVARRWQHALTALSRSLRVGGVDSAAWHGAKTAAVEVFLDLFPADDADLPPVLRQPRNARLRAAVEHVHEHAHEPITITDLSAASGLSVRSVQESFRRVFDVSPLTYLRQVRLDRVRAELLEAESQAGAVGDVARRWGFAHLGRFSAAYAERFGEYPKQTLRR